MYGAAAAVIAIPRTESTVIEIASPYCSMERSVREKGLAIFGEQ
jgi:hypothetical protein